MLNVLRWLLLPLGMVHWLAVRLRNIAYDRGWRQVYHLPQPVISVGNIQMGGTGKTPLVIALVELLQERGLRVGVLTRGYARRSRDVALLQPGDKPSWESVGDEPLLILAALRPGGVLGVGADRYATGRKLLSQHAVDVFVLDDGMQHRRLHRDADICLIDASRWARHPFLFPFSYLRDNKSSLRRVGLAVITKHEIAPENARRLRAVLSDTFDLPVTTGRYVQTALAGLDSGAARVLPEGSAIAAMCGIANPQYFRAMLSDRGWRIRLWRAWSDHHAYRREEIEAVLGEMDAAQIGTLVVTAKDAVKLRACLAGRPGMLSRIAVLKVSLAIEDPSLLTRLLDGLNPSAASGKNEIRG